MGGPSAEHEVSLATGAEVLGHLNRNKYRVKPVLITKRNEWLAGKKRVTPNEALRGVDVVFNAMHGEYGEDGKIQALLELRGLVYTGSGVAASMFGMDKFASRNIFKSGGLAVPKTLKITKEEYRNDRKRVRSDLFKSHSKGPWVIKPCSRGSSVGISIVRELRGFDRAFRIVFRFDDTALVENYLRGKEITVPVLERDSGRPAALPIVEIRPRKSAFFDYNEKYGKGGADEIVPAPISRQIRKRAEMAALAAHKLLGCHGYSRVDCIVVRGRPYILELNTLPGLTPASLFPKAAKAAGIDFSDLLDILIANALRKNERGGYG